jgi:LL-diaminopimelate aminotransferase
MINQKVDQYRALHPDAQIVSLGIGDVSRPLTPTITQALMSAAQEMGTTEGQRGYGPEQGYLFLRELIASHDFQGLNISPHEIFISDGSKCDSGNIQDLFLPSARIALANPTYPVYLDASVIAGHGGPLVDGQFSKILYLPCNEENHFLPHPPTSNIVPPDLIFLCSPNNPTGSVIPFPLLEQWVHYAIQHGSLILFDAAYVAYITDPTLPHSIFQIPGADKVAIELRSYSKSAGFTGLRCAYMVICEENPLYPLWKRRHATKFNAVAYPIQRAAAATYTQEAKMELQGQIQEYLSQAHRLKSLLLSKHYDTLGGDNAPFIWWKIPPQFSSWQYFDYLLNQYQIITTPGSGFGSLGEGYLRLSAFAKLDAFEVAMQRLAALPSLCA